MRVRITSEALAALRAHAAEEPDREVCGLLLGESELITRAVRTANVAADPRSHFEIDPSALIAAHRVERQGGAQLIGHYHSHPRGPPEPSATDYACSAGDGRVWLIVAGGEVGAWRADPRGFVPVQLALG